MRKRTLTLALLLALLFAGVISSLALRLFFTRLVRVPAGSMSNTILPGDCLLVLKSMSDLKRGQLVLFKHSDSPEEYVARVVALAGDSVLFSERSVIVNGEKLPEQRVIVEQPASDSFDPLKELSTEGTGPYQVFYNRSEINGADELSSDPSVFGIGKPYRVPAGNVFVVGDNRDNSYDSRFRGPVPIDLVWGKPSLIYWSAPVHSDQVRWDRVMKRIN